MSELSPIHAGRRMKSRSDGMILISTPVFEQWLIYQLQEILLSRECYLRHQGRHTTRRSSPLYPRACRPCIRPLGDHVRSLGVRVCQATCRPLWTLHRKCQQFTLGRRRKNVPISSSSISKVPAAWMDTPRSNCCLTRLNRFVSSSIFSSLE